MPVIESVVRPLSEQERRLLAHKLKRAERRLKNFPKRLLTAVVLIFGLLWIWTMAVAKSHWYIVTGVWLAIGGAICAWVYLAERPKEAVTVRRYGEALRRNEAREIRIQSDEMVELEEEEDEGATYAFQLAGRRIVFLSGQDFYPSARFPNTDLSLVDTVQTTMFSSNRSSRRVATN